MIAAYCSLSSCLAAESQRSSDCSAVAWAMIEITYPDAYFDIWYTFPSCNVKLKIPPMPTAIPPVRAPGCLQEYGLSYRPTTGVTSTTNTSNRSSPLATVAIFSWLFFTPQLQLRSKRLIFAEFCEYDTNTNHRRSNEGLMQSDNATGSISLLKEFFYKLLIWTIWEDLLIIDHDKALVLWL